MATSTAVIESSEPSIATSIFGNLSWVH
jgi:hypothetical protein